MAPPLRASLRRHLGLHPHGLHRWLVVIGLFAAVVRVVYILTVLDGYVLRTDASHYYGIADAVGDGRGFEHHFPFDFPHPTAWRPPLYPLVLGAVFSFTGEVVGVAQGVNVVLGSVVVVLAALFSWRLLGWRAGVVTGFLTATFPTLIFNDGVPLSESLGFIFLLVTFLLLLDWRVEWAGLTTGLLVLSRVSAQFFVVALAGWVLWRMGWRRALAFCGIVALVLCPWVLRNWVRLGTPVLFTSTGINLLATYGPEAVEDGGFVDPVYDPRLADVRAGIRNEVDLDAAFRRAGTEAIRDDPIQLIKVPWHNFKYLFEISPVDPDGGELVDGRSMYVRRLTLPYQRLMIIAGAISLWALRRVRGIGPVVLTATAFSFVSVVTVAAIRLRAPYDLASCIAVGGLVSVMAQRGADKKAGRSIPVVERAPNLSEL